MRQPLLVLLISVTVTGAACLWGVYTAPESFRVPLAWGSGGAAAVFCVTATIAAYQRQKVRLFRRRLAGYDAQAAALAAETVPAVVDRLRAGSSADTAMFSVPMPEHPAYQAVLRQLAHEVGRGENSRAAAMAACANAAGRMQALATSMLADLREMEHRHTDENVLGDLLHLDHRTAQAGRIADSIAVLTGSRSGRRWAKPIVMESILRGAMGRISGYQRIRLHSTSTVAVAGHAAEGVMHALAELLDNATSFSPPTAEVHVYVEEVPAGIVITVEDSGLVMGEVALRRAERAVSAEALDLTSLSGTRLGLAVVGCLARKHGLSVSFRPSARGGTGALMMIPQELITRQSSGSGAGAGASGGSTGAAAGGGAVAGTPASSTEDGALSLRRHPAAAASAAGVATTEGTENTGGTDLASYAAVPAAPDPTPAGGIPTQSRAGSAQPDADSAAGAARDAGRGTATQPGGTGTAAGTAPDTSPAGHDPAQPDAPSARTGASPAADGTGPAAHSAAGGGDPVAGAPGAHEGHAAAATGTGLHKRRRGETMAAAHAEPAPGEPDTLPDRRSHSPAESAARFGAFRRAVRGEEQETSTAPSVSSSPDPEDDAR